MTFRHTRANGFGWFGQGTELFDPAKLEFDFSKMEFVFGNQGWFSEIGVCLENQVLFSKIGICFFKIGNCSKKRSLLSDLGVSFTSPGCALSLELGGRSSP